jgi:hypothetical protein
MGRHAKPKFEVVFGDITLSLSAKEIEVIKCVAEGGWKPSWFGGGPDARLSTYLREKLGISGNPTTIYCRVAFGAGLVNLFPEGSLDDR